MRSKLSWRPVRTPVSLVTGGTFTARSTAYGAVPVGAAKPLGTAVVVAPFVDDGVVPAAVVGVTAAVDGAVVVAAPVATLEPLPPPHPEAAKPSATVATSPAHRGLTAPLCSSLSAI